MAQQLEEKKQDKESNAYDILQTGGLYVVHNQWGGRSDYLGFKDNGKWLKVGYEANLAVKWKVELHADYDKNHQIYLFETWFNNGYVGYRDSDFAMRCSYKENLKVPFEVVPVPEKGPKSFYLKQKWTKNEDKWVGYKDNDDCLYANYGQDLRVPFSFESVDKRCIGIGQYDDTLFDIPNGGSEAITVEDEYTVGISDKDIKEVGLDMSVGAKVTAGGSFMGVEMSAELSTTLSSSIKNTLEQSISTERKTKFTYKVPSKKRIVVTQKKVTIKMANGRTFNAASTNVSVVEYDL